MERFEDYWGAPAWLDKVTYKICENADALVMNLNGGSIDLCAHLTSAQASQLNQNFQVLEGTMNLVQAIYLNNQAKPFDNQLVRQALCYAIDRQGIMDMVADGHGTAVGSSIYPAFTKYFLPELVDKYPHDVAKAKELLAQAGYPDGFDMTISVPNNYQPHMDTAEVVAEQLREAGINVTIQPVEWSTWLDTIYNGRQFQATVVGVDAANMTARACWSGSPPTTARTSSTIITPPMTPCSSRLSTPRTRPLRRICTSRWSPCWRTPPPTCISRTCATWWPCGRIWGD